MDLNISGVLEETVRSLFEVVPNVLKALVVFIIGYLIVKFVTKLIKKLLEKIKIDKLGEKLNEIDFIAKSNIDIKFSHLISKGIYYFLMLFVIIISTDILGLKVVSELVGDIFNFIPNLFVAIIVLILGTIVADLIKKLVETALKSLAIPSAKMIANLVFYFIFINVLVSALTQAGIETTFLSQNITMVIGGAVLAFAISYGLAAKGTVSNYLATFYIKNKFEIGDTISFDDVKGKIIDIDKVSCIIKTETGKTVVPLNQLTKTNVEILE